MASLARNAAFELLRKSDMDQIESNLLTAPRTSIFRRRCRPRRYVESIQTAFAASNDVIRTSGRSERDLDILGAPHLDRPAHRRTPHQLCTADTKDPGSS